MASKSENSPVQGQVGGDHYKKLKIQPVEYIHANGIGFCEGSAIKYLTRWRDKGGIEDLKKAKHFIELLIDLETKTAAENRPQGQPLSYGDLTRHAAGLLPRPDSEIPARPTHDEYEELTHQAYGEELIGTFSATRGVDVAAKNVLDQHNSEQIYSDGSFFTPATTAMFEGDGRFLQSLAVNALSLDDLQKLCREQLQNLQTLTKTDFAIAFEAFFNNLMLLDKCGTDEQTMSQLKTAIAMMEPAAPIEVSNVLLRNSFLQCSEETATALIVRMTEFWADVVKIGCFMVVRFSNLQWQGEADDLESEDGFLASLCEILGSVSIESEPEVRDTP